MSGMAKTDTLGVRLDPNEKAALGRAAAADDRPMSALARKIIAEWLAKNGWMKGGKRDAKIAARSSRRGNPD